MLDELEEHAASTWAFLKRAYAAHVLLFVPIVLGATFTPPDTSPAFTLVSYAMVLIGFVVSFWITDLLVTGREDPAKNLVTGGFFPWLSCVLGKLFRRFWAWFVYHWDNPA